MAGTARMATLDWEARESLLEKAYGEWQVEPFITLKWGSIHVEGAAEAP